MDDHISPKGQAGVVVTSLVKTEAIVEVRVAVISCSRRACVLTARETRSRRRDLSGSCGCHVRLGQVNCPKARIAFYNKLQIEDKKLVTSTT